MIHFLSRTSTRRGSKLRRHQGAVLVEGVVALMLIIAGAIGGTLLLVNTGCATYYKEKLGFVDNQAATFAGNQVAQGVSDTDVQTQTETYVNDLLQKFGMPPAQDVTVTIDANYVTVASKLANLTLIGDGSILPFSVSVQDTSVVKRSTLFHPILLDLNLGSGGRFYVPSYRTEGILPAPSAVGTKPAKIFGRANFSAGFAAVTPAGVVPPGNYPP